MSAEIIEFGAYRPGFARKRRKGASVDFMRGRAHASALIRRADRWELERVFYDLVREAMRRQAKGGKGSRRPSTPFSHGFFQNVAVYIATGRILTAPAKPGW